MDQVTLGVMEVGGSRGPGPHLRGCRALDAVLDATDRGGPWRRADPRGR